MTINTQSVAYRDNYTELTGEFVWDAGRSDKRPGILVVHGGAGLDARAGMDVLLSHPQVDGRVAAVGYCFGGMVALELGRSGAEIAGAVSVHGSLSTPRFAQSGTVKAKILVCHGALDPHVPLTQGFQRARSGAR